MKNKPLKKRSPKLETFRQLVAQQELSVFEALSLGGDFPDCSPVTAEVADWQHVLSDRLATLFEQCRFDINDPPVNSMIRHELARLVAICEAWDKQLLVEAA